MSEAIVAGKARFVNLSKAVEIGKIVQEALKPHCDRIAIAGSVRRRKPFVHDIEFVVIPSTYQTGLFGDDKERLAGIFSIRISCWLEEKRVYFDRRSPSQRARANIHTGRKGFIRSDRG